MKPIGLHIQALDAGILEGGLLEHAHLGGVIVKELPQNAGALAEAYEVLPIAERIPRAG